MHRRSLLTLLAATATATAAAAAGAAPSPAARAAVAEPPRTRWRVRESFGLDALAFLGPLAGGELYRTYYAAAADAFAARLPSAVVEDLRELSGAAAKDGFGLLAPNLQVIFSSPGNSDDLKALLAALEDRDRRLRPAYRASPYWSEKDWAWFAAAAPRLGAIFQAMQAADFAGFRLGQTEGRLAGRAAAVESALSAYDVVRWQERLTGRSFEPVIEVVLLAFSKPHGVKVQGQTFLQAFDYDLATTVRIAAHEMLHPPIDMDGPAAKAALAVLRQDPLIARIVRDHDPQWGYETLEGLLDEDLCEALDQLISEGLGVARNPADRWRKSDDGMHVLAGALYGLLREDRWGESGGDLEGWVAQAARSGRLQPAVLHAAAARVLERPVGALWLLGGRGADQAPASAGGPAST